MSHGIKKETYVGADEKTGKALTFDLLDNIYKKVEEIKGCHDNHMEVCDARFRKIENRKKKDRALSAASGFGGGFVAMAAYYLRKLL